MADFDASRRDAEAQRREQAAARAEARRSAGPAPHSAGTDAGTGLAVLLGLVAGGLGIAGLVALPFVAPLGGLLLLGAGAAGFGAWRLTRGRGLPSLAASDELQRALDDVRRAVDRSRALSEDRKVELLASLQAALAELRARLARRDEAAGLLPNLDRDSDEHARLTAQLGSLDEAQAGFLANCRQVLSAVTALDLEGEQGSALADLAQQAQLLEAEREASAELERTLAVAFERQVRR